MITVFTTVMMGISNLFNKADRISASFWEDYRRYVRENYIGKIYFIRDVATPMGNIARTFGVAYYFKVDDIFPFIRNNVCLIKNVSKSNPSFHQGRYRVGNVFTAHQFENDIDSIPSGFYDPGTPGYVQLNKIDGRVTGEPVSDNNQGYIIISNTNVNNITGDANETIEAEAKLLRLRLINVYNNNPIMIIIPVIIVLLLIIYFSKSK